MWLGHHIQGQKVKGQGHQAALLSAAFTGEAAAAVSMGTYSAWETTSTLRCARRREAPTEGAWEERGRWHIVAATRRRLQLVIYEFIIYFLSLTCIKCISYIWFSWTYLDMYVCARAHILTCVRACVWVWAQNSMQQANMTWLDSDKSSTFSTADIFLVRNLYVLIYQYTAAPRDELDNRNKRLNG